jgi:hypothetical protein
MKLETIIEYSRKYIEPTTVDYYSAYVTRILAAEENGENTLIALHNYLMSEQLDCFKIQAITDIQWTKFGVSPQGRDTIKCLTEYVILNYGNIDHIGNYYFEHCGIRIDPAISNEVLILVGSCRAKYEPTKYILRTAGLILYGKEITRSTDYHLKIHGSIYHRRIVHLFFSRIKIESIDKVLNLIKDSTSKYDLTANDFLSTYS